jgi:hypothetical protein
VGRLLIALASLAALALAVTPPVGATSQPQVICISNSTSVETPEGSYATRPHSCNFHERGQPAAAFAMVAMRRIHWSSWSPTVAVGKGKSLVNMVGPVSTKVRLSAPQTVCGHLVFTQARFKGRSGGYGKPMQLDRRLAASSCAP